MPRAAVILLFSATALARPVLDVSEANLPLRVVIKTGGVRLANCIFATQPIPPHARFNQRQVGQFAEGDAMFARCYLPDRPGANRPGDLIDTFLLDGKPWWTQAYDAALPADALERTIMLGEVLRTPLHTVPPGAHRIELWGTMKRGGHPLKVYRGEFRYVR